MQKTFGKIGCPVKWCPLAGPPGHKAQKAPRKAATPSVGPGRTRHTGVQNASSHYNQLIGLCAKAYFLAVFHAAFPVGFGRGVGKVVVMVARALPGEVFIQQGARYHRHGVARIGAGHVQRNGVKAGKHAHIGNDGGVIFRMAVAVGRHLVHNIDVKSRAPVHHSLGILGHFAVQLVIGSVVGGIYRIEIARANAAPAAHALCMVNARLVRFVKGDGAVGAVFHARPARTAQGLIHRGLAGRMHIHLARARAAAHAHVFHRAAKARALVPFEMRKRNKHVRVHHGAPNQRVLDVLAALHGHSHLVCALQAVCNDNLAAGGKGRIAVFIGGVHMVQRILAPAHIQCVAVCQKRLAAQGLHHVGHRLGKIRAQVGKIARFAEVDFDGGIFVFEIYGLKARAAHQFFQLLLQVGARAGTHIGKIYF